jgi:hypothetical protein
MIANIGTIPLTDMPGHFNGFEMKFSGQCNNNVPSIVTLEVVLFTFY